MMKLLSYNPAWPKYFNEEKESLKNILGSKCVSIEHIGSTAIPGLKAKPVIDIMVAVKEIDSFSINDIKRIESLGYKYNAIFESEFPNRRYFQKNNSDDFRTHQIHLVNYPSSWFEKHILFRDYLRKYQVQAREYESLKIRLTEKFDDTISYAKAKTEFCQDINNKAYFDFTVHKPNAETLRLFGFIPQIACFPLYKNMFQDSKFIHCYGVAYSDEKIKQILERDMSYWDKYGFGPYVRFDKNTHYLVGENGLNHANPNDIPDRWSIYYCRYFYW